MPISFKCPHCGNAITAPDTAAGVSGPCPKCRQTVTAPNTQNSGAPAQMAPSAPIAPRQGSAKATAPALHNADPFTCPACSGGEVQKVSAIVQTGTWNGGTRGAAATDGMYVGREWNQGQGGAWEVGGVHAQTRYSTTTRLTTDLAQMLQPPAEPRRPAVSQFSLGFCITDGLSNMGIGALIGGLVGVCAAVAYSGCASAASSGSGDAVAIRIGVGIFALGILIPGFLTALSIRDYLKEKGTYPARQAEYERNLSAWQQAMRWWDSLFFCPRCGNVYNSETGQTAPPTEMTTLLG